MEPINYNTAVVNPVESTYKGMALGMQMKQAKTQAQIQQMQLEQQMQMQQNLAKLAMNPNASGEDYARMMTAYPQLSEHLKRGWDVLNADQQQGQLNNVSKVYAALQSNNNDVAADLLTQQAKAYENSGDTKNAQTSYDMAQMIQLHPTMARNLVGSRLMAILGPEKFSTAFSTLGAEQRANEKQPADVAKAEADAAKAQYEAGNMPTKIGLDNQKAAEDIETAKQKRQLDVLDMQIKTANSETERGKLQLERDKLVNELGLKQQQIQADSQNQLDTVNNSISTVKQLMEHPLWKSSIGVGSSVGKALSMVPGTDNKDFDALLNTVKSQQFLTAAKEMKGMGALSDAEGARIERAVAALDRDQSPAAMKTALTTVLKTLERAQQKIVASGKLQTGNGGAFVMQHPTYGTVADGTVNRLLQQFPGATREQVIQYLQQTGGK